VDSTRILNNERGISWVRGQAIDVVVRIRELVLLLLELFELKSFQNRKRQSSFCNSSSSEDGVDSGLDEAWVLRSVPQTKVGASPAVPAGAVDCVRAASGIGVRVAALGDAGVVLGGLVCDWRCRGISCGFASANSER